MRERRLLHDGQDVGLTHDGALFAVHLDLGAGVFAGEHLIAHLDGHLDFLAVHDTAGADGHDLCHLRLLLWRCRSG